MSAPAAYRWRKSDGTLLGQVDGVWLELAHGVDRDAAMRSYARKEVGRAGGAVGSEAQKAAARENGKLGGRPKRGA